MSVSSAAIPFTHQTAVLAELSAVRRKCQCCSISSATRRIVLVQFLKNFETVQTGLGHTSSTFHLQLEAGVGRMLSRMITLPWCVTQQALAATTPTWLTSCLIWELQQRTMILNRFSHLDFLRTAWVLATWALVSSTRSPGFGVGELDSPSKEGVLGRCLLEVKEIVQTASTGHRIPASLECRSSRCGTAQ